jgi:hypothetical protein
VRHADADGVDNSQKAKRPNPVSRRLSVWVFRSALFGIWDLEFGISAQYQNYILAYVKSQIYFSIYRFRHPSLKMTLQVSYNKFEKKFPEYSNNLHAFYIYLAFFEKLNYSNSEEHTINSFFCRKTVSCSFNYLIIKFLNDEIIDKLVAWEYLLLLFKNCHPKQDFAIND